MERHGAGCSKTLLRHRRRQSTLQVVAVCLFFRPSMTRGPFHHLLTNITRQANRRCQTITDSKVHTKIDSVQL